MQSEEISRNESAVGMGGEDVGRRNIYSSEKSAGFHSCIGRGGVGG